MGMQLSGDPVSPESSDLATDLRLPGSITIASAQGYDFQGNKPEDSDPPTKEYSYSVCTISQTFVDSHVSCLGYQCEVDEMRPSHNTPSLAAIDASFLQAFVNETSGYESGDYTFTERYIQDPGDVMDSHTSSSPNLSAVTPQDFRQRFSLLLNTFWQAGFDPANQTVGVGTESNVGTVVSTPATYQYTQQVYRTSWAWLAVLFASSVILLVAGVAGVIWDSRIIGPDILGFASSLTRNNKYMDLPKGDSTMGGAERARMLRDVEVMIQDVKAGSEVGKIALGTVSESTQKLKPGRLYR